MKILFFIPFPVVGGAELQIKYLINEFRSDIKCSIAYQYGDVAKFASALGVPHYQVYSPMTLAKTISEVKPDIVHFYHSQIMYQALKKLSVRPKTYEVVHNRLPFDGDCFGYPKDMTDHMVCVSEDAKAYCESRLPNFPTIAIPNGVDTNVFHPRPKIKPGGMPMLGGFSGRLEPGPGKGIPELIDVVKDLPCQFELVGRDFGSFARQIKDRGITNIRVVPHTDNIQDFYARWDFFASRSPAEGFGLSIAEAISCGLPSVVYNCGGVCNYLKHGSSALIANSDEEFRIYLKQLVTGQRWDLRPRDADLSATTMAARYRNFYDRLLESDRRIEVSAPAPGGRPIERLAVVPQDWHGVKRALSTFTDRHTRPEEAIASIKAFKPRTVVYGCYMPSWERVLMEAKKQGCKNVLTWHASYILNEFDHVNREWMWHAQAAYKKGLFDYICTPHEGLAKTWTQFGFKTDYMPNVVDETKIPKDVIRMKGVNIGILGSGQPWKNMDCQIVAASLIGGANIHVQKVQHRQAIDVLGCKVISHTGSLTDDEYYRLVGGMSVNMVMSLSEVYSYLGAESLLMGVPILTLPITPILKKSDIAEMQSPHFEDPWAMAEDLRHLILRSVPLGDRGRRHMLKLNEENKKIAASVVEKWV